MDVLIIAAVASASADFAYGAHDTPSLGSASADALLSGNAAVRGVVESLRLLRRCIVRST